MPRDCLLYGIGTHFDAVTLAAVVARLRERLPAARHVIVDTGSVTAAPGLRAVLGLQECDYLLETDAGSPVTETTRIMERIERVIEVEQPNLIVVAGDSGSTLASALTALKLGIPSAHLDSGLRTHDRKMPAEMNRVIVDSFADLLFVSGEQGLANLKTEGVDVDRVHVAGSTAADTLHQMATISKLAGTATRLGLRKGAYLLVSLQEAGFHNLSRLRAILDRLMELSRKLPVIFPVGEKVQQTVGRYVDGSRLRLTDPLDYLDFLSLQLDAAAVLTDRGGIQEETTYLGVPCFTAADCTERMPTLLHGTNRLIGADPNGIDEILPALEDRRQPQAPPPLWDGRASERVAEVLAEFMRRQTAGDPIAGEVSAT
ncbi:MAG TPA: UDP-N-acetylglucosamine 2-epimerase [Solirubrobacterales bacterium]|nr:UDP-N-acetylglucosamine 2-epimerase [Solirubrobacterales bacterium]